MKTHEQVKRELLADHEVRTEYDALDAEFSLRRAIIQLRNSTGLSQRAVAETLGTYQSALSRLESGRTNVTIGYLAKVANALDSDLELCFVPRASGGKTNGIRVRVPAHGD